MLNLDATGAQSQKMAIFKNVFFLKVRLHLKNFTFYSSAILILIIPYQSQHMRLKKYGLVGALPLSSFAYSSVQ